MIIPGNYKTFKIRCWGRKGRVGGILIDFNLHCQLKRTRLSVEWVEMTPLSAFRKEPQWVIYNRNEIEILLSFSWIIIVTWKVLCISILKCILKFLLGVVQLSRAPEQAINISVPSPLLFKTKPNLGSALGVASRSQTLVGTLSPYWLTPLWMH